MIEFQFHFVTSPEYKCNDYQIILRILHAQIIVKF